jgi:hypothetical protein
MTPMLVKALIASVPTVMLFAASIIVFTKQRTAASLSVLVGAAGFVVMVATHIAEGLHLLPSMGWGQRHRAGLYLDLASAILGITLISSTAGGAVFLVQTRLMICATLDCQI